MTYGGNLGHFLADKTSLSDYGFTRLTLGNIIGQLAGPRTVNEVKLKDFYAHVLALPWSDHELETEHNPFARFYTRRADSIETKVTSRVDLSLQNVGRAEARHPRLAGQDGPALITLRDAAQDPIVTGRKSNLILDPATTANDLRAKLLKMNEAELDKAYANIQAYPRHLPYAEKINAVVDQAVTAATAWVNAANDNCRPVYTAPSGHMITHARAFYAHVANCTNPADHPTLEQFRLAMLATMIGFKQHNSYEEAMFPLHGFEHGGQVLGYNDRAGYRDIIDSTDPFIRAIGEQLVAAAYTIAKDGIQEFYEFAPALDPPVASYIPDVMEWFEIATGKVFADYVQPPSNMPLS